MATESTSLEIEYPESDGVPMGESDLHRNWIVRLIRLLEYRYRNERAYVTGDLLLYYKEGDPRTVICPDVFLVKDHPRGLRGVYKLWKEGRPPDIAFEITSHTTHRKDIAKIRKYLQIGVSELFLFDPTADYLDPILQGYRLTNGEYETIPCDDRGQMCSHILNANVFLQDSDLVIADPQTGEPWQTADEAAEAAHEAQRKQVVALQAEVQRLRAQLERPS